MSDATTNEATDRNRGPGFVRRLRDERGATLALVALGSAVLIGMAAISIDLGMLMTAKSQAQRAADSGAHAGAVALARTPGNEAGAQALAVDAAADNAVMGESVVVQPGDVTFPADDEVKVTVHRIQARDNPIGTFFARILGFNAVDLSVDATAHVATPGDFEVDCLLPLSIQDLWREADGSIPEENDTFDPDDGDVYVPWSEDADNSTGYSGEHIGMEFVLKSNQGGGTFNPSWYGPWTDMEDDSPGASWYRDRITGDECGTPKGPGDVVDTEPGNMVGPSKQGFRALIDKDPGAQWNDAWTPDCDCDPVTGGQGMNSPRIRPIPMFRPPPPESGRQQFELTNFAGIFVEEIRGNDITGRFMGLVAAKTGDSGEDDEGAGPIPKVIEIIE